MKKRITNYKRRSISIPIELEEIIEKKFERSEYSFINDMIIELLELGIIKLNEDEEIKKQNNIIINKLDKLILMCDKWIQK